MDSRIFVSNSMLIGHLMVRHEAYDGRRIGLLRFVEGGLECSEQPLGQIADESDRIGKQHAAALGQPHGPHGGIERGKERILNEYTSVG